ncbi:MAG: hypothetical protein B7Z42_06725 [Brevundimonas sp. 12-68-7]|nr:MAG: hypothetical protein B7Z42_06725 [Brevundimonas sp. 12-68-7]
MILTDTRDATTPDARALRRTCAVTASLLALMAAAPALAQTAPAPDVQPGQIAPSQEIPDETGVVNRILVHGEAVHTLQRAINAGSFSKPRGQREEDLYAVSGSLTLMTNLCLAWTAIKMQETIFGEDGMADEGEDMSWLQQVSPAHYANINFRGTFTFPISDYALWLLSDSHLKQQTG